MNEKIKEYVEGLPIIEFTEKFNMIDCFTECPQCRAKHLTHVPYVNVPCGKCGITYVTDFKQSMLQKRLFFIEHIMSNNNGCVIKSEKTFLADLYLLKENYKKKLAYDIPEEIKDEESHKRCAKCGICNSCFQCNKCNTHFQRIEGRKKLVCPKCHSSENITKTNFKEAKETNGTFSCPECNSNKVVMTRTEKMTSCHKCNSKKLSDKITTEYFYQKIKRKGGYLIKRD
jgi:hypothetical protein